MTFRAALCHCDLVSFIKELTMPAKICDGKALAKEIENDSPVILKNSKITPTVRDFLLELTGAKHKPYITIFPWIVFSSVL